MTGRNLAIWAVAAVLSLIAIASALPGALASEGEFGAGRLFAIVLVVGIILGIAFWLTRPRRA
jgi:hypothetical protein